MNKATRFVYGGGTFKTFEKGRPITRWLVVAAVFSCAPAMAGVVMAWLSESKSPSLWAGILTFPSCLLVASTPILIVSAIISFFLEHPRTIITEQPNPHYDPHNLY